MKKFIFVFILVLFPFITSANDGYGIPYYFTHDKVACVIVENANEFNNSDTYLYFNYSKEVGEKLGRPWTLVEPNKCYEYGGEETWTNDGKQTSFGSDFYLVVSDDKNFINYLNSEAKEIYKQLPEYIQTLNNGDRSVFDYKINENTLISLLGDYNDNLRSRGLGGGDSLVNVLGDIDFSLFNYSFGEGITGGTSVSDLRNAELFLLANNFNEEAKTFNYFQEQVINTLNLFKKDVSSIYNTCLTNVKRFETKVKIESEPLYDSPRYSLGLVGKFIRFTDDKLYSYKDITQLNNLISDSCKVKLQATHQKYIKEINEKGKAYYEYSDFVAKKLASATYKERENYWNKLKELGYYGELTESDKIDYFPTGLGGTVSINPNVKKFELLIDNSKLLEVKEDNKVVESDSEDVSVLQKTENNISEAIKEKNYLFILYLLLPILLIFGLYIYSKKK